VTFSLGSGNAGDAIFLFMSDICGESENPPRHAHAFGDLAPLQREMYRQRVAALQAFHVEVTAMKFPYAGQSVGMHAGEEAKLLEALDKL
jgi:3-methyl-2-oxobutanoate hydroxymethyltransferase